MIRVLLSRLGWGAATLLAVSLLIFAATELLPGDTATAALGRGASEAAVTELRASLGLERFWLLRYGEWLGHMLTGELGVSMSSGREIGAMLADRLANTARLAGLTALWLVPLSLALGVLAAWRHGSLTDRGLQVGALAALSVPEFFTGSILVIVFAVELRWFPAIARVREGMDLLEQLRVLALPMLTLAAVVMGYMMRMTRTAILQELSSAYVEMARLKGVSEARIIWLHALPNALGPIVNVVALSLAYLVVGVIVVEVLFSYPGVGQLLVDGVSKRDYPLVQACALIFAATYVALNWLADTVSILANPRLRMPK